MLSPCCSNPQCCADRVMHCRNGIVAWRPMCSERGPIMFTVNHTALQEQEDMAKRREARRSLSGPATSPGRSPGLPRSPPGSPGALGALQQQHTLPTGSPRRPPAQVGL